MHVCAPCGAGLVLLKVRRVYLIPWNWSYRWFWTIVLVLEIESWCSARATNVLNHWDIYAVFFFNFWNLRKKKVAVRGSQRSWGVEAACKFFNMITYFWFFIICFVNLDNLLIIPFLKICFFWDALFRLSWLAHSVRKKIIHACYLRTCWPQEWPPSSTVAWLLLEVTNHFLIGSTICGGCGSCGVTGGRLVLLFC